MNVHAEGRDLCGRKMPSFDFVTARLNRGISFKQASQVKHRHSKSFADEVARLVNGDAVGWSAVAVQHENPFEAVLRKLSANIRNKGSQRGPPNTVCTGMDQHVVQIHQLEPARRGL
jgi:hypothetical protein